MTVIPPRFHRPRWPKLAALLLAGALFLPAVRPAAAQTPPPVHSISGMVELESVITGGGDTRQPITFQLTPSGGGSVIVYSVTLDSQGNFTLPGLPAGTYTLNVVGAKWIRSAAQTVNITTADATSVYVFLTGGDANHDNSVDSTDFGILIGAYNSSVARSGSGYNAAADFNCDGSVDSTDFGILFGNFNAAGAIYELSLSAVTSGGQVTLSWQTASGAVLPGVTYNLYRSTTPAHGATPYRTGLTATSFIDSNTLNGVYYYQVVAAGQSIGMSDEISVTVGGGNAPAPAAEPGNATAWEAMVGGVNTASGNKLTELPLFSWTARGGMSVDLTLSHNSQGTENGPLGPRWTHSFDLTGSVDQTTGSVTLHDGDGRLTKYTLINGVFHAPPGFHSILTLNGSGYKRVTKSQITYQYDANLRCQSITDTNGNTITLTYNGALLNTVTDPTGRVLQFGYNSSSQMTSVQDPQTPTNRIWLLSYGPGGLAQVQEPNLSGDPASYSTGYTYDGNNEINAIQTRKGPQFTWHYTVDAQGRQTSQTDPMSNATIYTYPSVTTAAGILAATVVTDPNGNSNVEAYDGNGRLTFSEDAESYAAKTEYDSANNVTKVTDRRGKVWQYTSYDSKGNLLTAFDPLFNATVYTYNAHNRLLTLTDPNDNPTKWDYDTHDNLTKITNGNGNFTTLAVDAATGLISSRTNFSGTAFYYYDANGSLQSMKDGNGHITTYAPNALGWNLSTTDANLRTTNYNYDTWGRLTSEVQPQDANTAYSVVGKTYDANDNLMSVEDSNFHTTSYTYDLADRLTLETRGNLDTIAYGYDASGQKGLVSYKLLGNGSYTAYAYTSREEVSGMVDAIGTRDAWAYDPNGNLASHTDPNGVTTGYDYDDRDYLLHINYPTNPQVVFAYDPAGRKTSMTDATGITGYDYDNDDNLTEIVSPNNAGSVAYVYDAANRRHTMTLNGTQVYTYGYDAADNLTSVQNPFNELTGYAYDPADRLTTQTNANGTNQTTAYDAQDRVMSVATTDASNALIQKQAYTYDAAGNLTSRSDSDASGLKINVGYLYDGYDQLTGESAIDGMMQSVYSRSFTYDHAGNRTNATHTENGVTTSDAYTYLANSNRLQSAGARSYGYDAAGNVKTLSLSGTAAQSFTYDEENRVSRIDYPALAGGKFSAFLYNGLRLRTAKKDINSVVSQYITDGDSPGADVLTDGQAVYTPGVSENRGGVSHFDNLDALGHLRGQTNAAKTLTDTLTSDAFGQTVAHTGTNPLPFGFEADAQYQTDSDSGLTLVGNRYYDAAIGRYLQPDPSGQEDNDYAYAENNPLANDDPEGLQDTVKQAPKGDGSGQQTKKKTGKKKAKGKGKSGGKKVQPKSSPPKSSSIHPKPKAVNWKLIGFTGSLWHGTAMLCGSTNPQAFAVRFTAMGAMYLMDKYGPEPPHIHYYPTPKGDGKYHAPVPDTMGGLGLYYAQH